MWKTRQFRTGFRYSDYCSNGSVRCSLRRLVWKRWKINDWFRLNILSPLQAQSARENRMAIAPTIAFSYANLPGLQRAQCEGIKVLTRTRAAAVILPSSFHARAGQFLLPPLPSLAGLVSRLSWLLRKVIDSRDTARDTCELRRRRETRWGYRADLESNRISIENDAQHLPQRQQQH